MVGPIFDEWKISDLELESEVGSEEVEVAISGRNVGRGRSWGGRGTTLVVGETSTAGQGWGVGVKIPFCSVIIELLTFCRSGIGQCTHCRGGAESVLTLSSTVIGVGLHRLGANLTRRKGKYTSASPRCTCLPSRQICIGVALGDPPQTPLQCWLVGRTSTPRLRLGVLASQLVNIALKLHSEENKYISAKLKFNSASPRWTSTWPRCTCSPPRATSAQGHLVQVQLGCASLNLDLDSVALSGVNAGPPRATSVKSISAKLKSNSALPRWTSTWPRWTWLESVVDHLVQLHSSSILVKLNLRPSRWSSTPITVELNIQFFPIWEQLPNLLW